MKTWHCLVLGTSVAMAGCASKPVNFTPADPEMMQEWQVEGSMKIEQDSHTYKTYFTWTQFADKYVLELRPDSTVGPIAATLRGSASGGDVTLQPGEAHSQVTEAVEAAVKNRLPLENFGFWLRGLPASGEAKMTESGVRTLESMDDSGWHLKYGDFMQLGTYAIPEEIDITGKSVEVSLEMVRGEPGYLTSTCSHELNTGDSSTAAGAPSAIAGNTSSAPAPVGETQVDGATVVAKLVPANGEAPLPQWVNDKEFCDQLKKIHGTIPEPRVGLYGPDSMMWKISRPAISGAWGAGRALLLQTAHPWVTAGIDEHSIVREDPMLRARRTFINIFTMIYGSMPQVMASANLVHKSHNAVTGEIPYEAGAFKKHSEYRANEVNAMIWVHATLWDTLVRMYEEMEEPLTREEKDRFYEETKLFAMLFGIPRDALPPDWDSFMAYNQAMWESPQLTVTPAARKLKEDLFHARSLWLVVPLYAQEIITARNLPPRIREGYGMDYGWWAKLNYTMFKSSAILTNWILPKTMEYNPVYLEAEARLHGERVGYLQRKAIAVGLERERLVN